MAGRPSWIDTVGTGSEIRKACDMVNLASIVMAARSEIEKGRELTTACDGGHIPLSGILLAHSRPE